MTATVLDKAPRTLEMALCPNCSLPQCESFKRPKAYLLPRYSRKMGAPIYGLMPCCLLAGQWMKPLWEEGQSLTPEDVVTVAARWEACRTARYMAGREPGTLPHQCALEMLAALERRAAQEAALFNPKH